MTGGNFYVGVFAGIFLGLLLGVFVVGFGVWEIAKMTGHTIGYHEGITSRDCKIP